MVTASSTLDAVFVAQSWGPSADELGKWNTATKHLTADTVTTKVGLFTEDLTTFRANCATATTNCVPATYTAALFSGAAIGVNWTSTKATADEATINGVCFSAWKDCVELTFVAAANTWETYHATAAVTAALPSATAADFDATCVNTNPFTGWYGAMVAGSTKT